MLYTKDLDDPKRWIIDNEAAEVVRRIFEMRYSGYGIGEISSIPSADKILTPTAYWQSKGMGGGGKKTALDPANWRHSTVAKLLSLQDKLFERLYEDNVSGKIDNARFSKMSKRYEEEQGENAAKGKALKKELKDDGGQIMTADLFLEMVRRDSDVTQLSQRLVTEPIDHIVIHHAEKVSGRTTQNIVIHYNLIGPLTVPMKKDIPAAAVSINTRQGVMLEYTTKAG